jgi:hypothetical protein
MAARVACALTLADRLMIKRSIPLLLLMTACAGGESEESPSSFSASFTASMGSAGDGDGDTEESGDGDPSGDGDGDPSGDGDGDPTGDGDGDPTGDGDGDGDGDVDPCVLICDGKIDSTPNTCDGPYIIGRSAATSGFFFGGSTQSATNSESGACGPLDNPDNLDQAPDHFFRIWLVLGDTITVTQNPNNWDARLKIHDEAECVGSAKACTLELDPATLEYEAPKTDWFTIVADGRSTGLGDLGDYTLSVDLVAGPNLDECACL